MLENVIRCGTTPVVVNDTWGTAVDPQKVEDALKANPNANLLAFVHAETSTGARSGAQTLCQLAKQYRIMRSDMIKGKLQPIIEFSSTFSLAAQQNAYPLFRSIRLHYDVSNDSADDNTVEEIPPLRNLVVRLTAESEVFATEEWIIDEINPNQTVSLPEKNLNIPYDFLSKLTEERRLVATLTVSPANDSINNSDNVYLKEEKIITILPENYWGGESRQPELLAAFIQPNGIYVESLVRQVTQLLEKEGHGRSVDGYQSNTREKPYIMTAALWSVIYKQQIAYVSPPQGFARQGQRIRLAAEISTSKLGACLDTSLLFASCLESMGLNPVIALSKEHAFVGVWLIDERFSVLTNDDPMDLRKRAASRDLLLFESTLVTNVSPVTLQQAENYAHDLISEDNEHDFVYVIDIKQARARKIKPLSAFEERPQEQSASIEDSLNLPAIPPMPPVRGDDRVIIETPDTRVDSWLRKLLDLTKRNPLLAFTERRVAISIDCPNISTMEDGLASGKLFTFLSNEELYNTERSEETFRSQTGSNINTEYALEQLKNNVLIAKMPKKKLEQNAITLVRKAKNDLEEGGANTLYLALGMLRWKETPQDTRSYRAPLILIPVQLTRKSAKADVKMEQLADEKPIFNTTLIEFLYRDYSIDLNQFREDLPEDDSGVDVQGIWNTVREAIAEQTGLEVVEELVLASFSFTKYLMWKDLKDRMSELKENPFVKHLVDHPQNSYVQDENFVPQEEVDKQIDPEKLFAPLNCDSSQLVAIEASGKSQDFILEGPPGTGKSETIANIICHNLALGRKVLFVAEKMAALNVVYDRIKKIRLDHLCLELHSNKVNKKAVIEQLNRAVNNRQEVSDEGWIESVREVKNKRNRLNDFVEILHRKSIYGISVREAIAQSVYYKNTRKLTLDWPLDFEAAPVQTQSQVKEMCETANMLALAYTDIADLNVAQFRILNARSWSNAWQSQVVDCLRRYKSTLNELNLSAINLSSSFNITPQVDNLANLSRVNSLAELIDSAESNPLSYLLAKGSQELLEDLNNLGETKREFDQHLSTIAHNVSPKILGNTPIAKWKDIYAKAKHSRLKRFFAKMKVNGEAQKLGYAKFKSLEILSTIEKASDLQKTIITLAPSFEEDKIWKGWETTPEDLNKAAVRGRLAHKALLDIVALYDEPAEVIKIVKSKLVDGRDFLDSSKLMHQKNEFKQLWDAFNTIATDATKLHLNFARDEPLKQTVVAIDMLIENAVKFKSWSEWLEAKEKMDAYRVNALTEALEARSILPQDAEAELYIAFCCWLAPQLIDDCEQLRQFKASTHEQLIENFRKLDADVAKATSNHIAAIAAQIVPDPFAKDSPKEFGVLAKELSKKTKHKPVRALISEMGMCLLDLCPCMMMSPLSVAQFLPANFNNFDLVVFDEASQMTTWDSVGAIARGKNVIVVGDPKQMPPTNFFNRAEEEDSDEEDLQSILDQALAARLHHLRLKGHYRSRHETLIAFSNSKYYENSLMTYPASNTKDSAVTLHRVAGVYTKGKGRNNPIEAKAVVAEVIKRLTDSEQCKKSIGIVTLNSEQQRTIEDLLDDARRQHPDIEHYFHSTDTYDGVFVKNLESVQGDERDIIMLSFAYGPTELKGPRMSMNFGPLNKSGGERRLNVAITRATTEVLVFSSFDSSMIDLSRTSAEAVVHLKHYLEFAEKGPSVLARQSKAEHGVDQFDSDFEEAVALALRSKGWNVQTQIGVSKFRIDLGVRHPEFPGEYLAGIECDGATYHRSPSARDRDRIRQGVLENLGWKIIRIWSTDYFQDPDGVLSRTIQKLNDILLERRQKEREADREKQNHDVIAKYQERRLEDNSKNEDVADGRRV